MLKKFEIESSFHFIKRNFLIFSSCQHRIQIKKFRENKNKIFNFDFPNDLQFSKFNFLFKNYNCDDENSRKSNKKIKINRRQMVDIAADERMFLLPIEECSC